MRKGRRLLAVFGVVDIWSCGGPDSGKDGAIDAKGDRQVDVGKPDVGTLLDGAKTDAISIQGFVSIPAGTYQMGAPTSESCNTGYEYQHQVTLTHGFEILDHEVTQGEFQSVMGGDGLQPVERQVVRGELSGGVGELERSRSLLQHALGAAGTDGLLHLQRKRSERRMQ